MWFWGAQDIFVPSVLLIWPHVSSWTDLPLCSNMQNFRLPPQCSWVSALDVVQHWLVDSYQCTRCYQSHLQESSSPISLTLEARTGMFCQWSFSWSWIGCTRRAQYSPWSPELTPLQPYFSGTLQNTMHTTTQRTLLKL